MPTPSSDPHGGDADPDDDFYTAFTDAEVLERHRQDDPHAFAEIVRRHQDHLWALAMRTLGDADDAADAVQEALISAYRAADRFRGDAAVSTWLYRIVVNACIDQMRRQRVRPPRANITDISEVVTIADPRRTIDDRLLGLEVQQALATLPPDQRAAVILVDVLGYSVVDAAAVLEVPQGTIKSRCSRGRARLLPLLAHLRNPDAPEAVQRPTPARSEPFPEGGDSL